MGSLSTRRLTIFLSAIVMAAPYQLLWADDVERVHHRDTTVPACATEADRARGLQLFSRHWMDAVYETTVPARREPLVSLEMFASPGEYEPVAFGLRSLVELSKVRLTARRSNPMLPERSWAMKVRMTPAISMPSVSGARTIITGWLGR